jgi:hypothetical protein
VIGERAAQDYDLHNADEELADEDLRLSQFTKAGKKAPATQPSSKAKKGEKKVDERPAEPTEPGVAEAARGASVDRHAGARRREIRLRRAIVGAACKQTDFSWR